MFINFKISFYIRLGVITFSLIALINKKLFKERNGAVTLNTTALKETAMQSEGNGRHLLLLLVIPMLAPIPRLSVTNPCSIFPCLGRAEMGGGVHHKDVTL